MSTSGSNAGRYATMHPAAEPEVIPLRSSTIPRPPPLPLVMPDSIAPTAAVAQARARVSRESGFRERFDTARNDARPARSSVSAVVSSGAAGVVGASTEPAALHVHESAESAREAGLAFLEGVRSGFDKRALASWLIGPYRTAVSFARSALARRDSNRPPPLPVETLPLTKKKASPSEPPPALHEIHAIRVEALDSVLYRARVQALAALEGASHSRNRPAFVQEAIARGHVVAVDVGGVIGYFARDLPGMHLRDRVLSLFAADYLARPAEYASALLVCPWCESVRFDASVRERGMCADHDRPSGVATKSAVDDVPNVRPVTITAVTSAVTGRGGEANPGQAKRDEAYERAVRAVLDDDGFDATDAVLRMPMRALIAG